MNKDEKKLEHGELFRESFDFMHITWKIPNASSFPNTVGYIVPSNVFSFAGATWRLQIYPCGIDRTAKGSISFRIVRLHSDIPRHFIYFKIAFKTRSGREFHSVSYNDILLDSKSNNTGVDDFISNSSFKQKTNLIDTNGVLTIICDIRTKRNDGVSKYTQVESAELFLESDDTKESSVDKSSVGPESNIQKHAHSPSNFPAYRLMCSDDTEESSVDNQILGDFKKLFLDQEDCDVTINVKGREFKAHRLILKARSPVFALTFRNDMKVKSTGIIDIEDCDPSVFSSFLVFLYCGDVENLSVENMFSLFTVAHKYDVQSLRKKCLQFIKSNLSVDTLCNILKVN